MAERANPAVVGGFVVGALVLAMGGLLLFGGGKFFRKTIPCVLYFSGAVNGLTAGSPVTFMGVKIGAVTEIHILGDPESLKFLVPVTVEIERGGMTIIRNQTAAKGMFTADPKALLHNLIEKGLRGQLHVRSMVTGQLEVALAFYPKTAAQFLDPFHAELEIPTIPSSMEELTKTLDNLPIEELMKSILATVKDIQKVVSDPEITGAIKSADETIQQAGTLLKNLDTTRTAIEGAVADVRNLTGHVDGQVKPLTEELTETARNVRLTLAQAEQTLKTAQSAVADDSDTRQALTKALGDISKAADAMGTLANLIDRQPESLIRGKRGE